MEDEELVHHLEGVLQVGVSPGTVIVLIADAPVERLHPEMVEVGDVRERPPADLRTAGTDPLHTLRVLVVVHDHVGAAAIELDDPAVLLRRVEECRRREPRLFTRGEEPIEGQPQLREHVEDDVGPESVIECSTVDDGTGLGVDDPSRPGLATRDRVEVGNGEDVRPVVLEVVVVRRGGLVHLDGGHAVCLGERPFSHLTDADEGLGVEDVLRQHCWSFRWWWSRPGRGRSDRRWRGGGWGGRRSPRRTE